MDDTRMIDKLKLEVVAFFCVASMTAIFGTVWYSVYSKLMIYPFYFKGNLFVILLFFAIFMLSASVYDVFKISVSKVSEMIYSEVLALLVTDIIMYVIIVLLSREIQNAIPLLLTFLSQCSVAVLWAMIAHKWYFACHPPKKTVIVWDERRDFGDLIHMYKLGKRYKVVNEVRAEICIAHLEELLGDADAVFLSGVHSHDRNMIIKYCVKNNIDAYVIPRVGDAIMGATRPLHLFHLPVYKLERYCPSIRFMVIKRIGDIFVSGLALIILSPLMLIVAIIIKMTDGGTVLYRQCRLTKDGKKFYVLKFRSMRMDAEKDGIARLSTGAADDRITPIGRIIRAVRIDELPQLINILKGEMAIVGPRPERPEIAVEYEKTMPEFALRLQAKAGLTGYAQVYGRYNTTPYDKLLMDLSYIANPSLVEDFKICMATVKILFMPESTEGIAVGERTAMGAMGMTDKPRRI